jgi:hypothetical protein
LTNLLSADDFYDILKKMAKTGSRKNLSHPHIGGIPHQSERKVPLLAEPG